MRAGWMLATMLLAGCRPTVQPIAATGGKVLAIALGGGDVWWLEAEGDDARIRRAPINGGEAENVCAVDASYGLAVLGGEAFVVQPTVGHDLTVASCARGSETPRSAVVLRNASAPVANGDALVWLDLSSDGFGSTVALRRWSPGTVAPETLWSGGAMTIPPPMPAVRDDGTILWEGSGGVMSMSPDGRIARVAAEPAGVTLAAGGRAWWERPVEWDAPSPTWQIATQVQALQPPPPEPSVWQRVRTTLGLPQRDPADPGRLTIDGAAATVETGIVPALASDARGVAWVDDGVPLHVHHGPPGNWCDSCYDSVEPEAGTGAVRLASPSGVQRTIAHGEFAPAIALDGDWVYVADAKSGRIERISRPR